MNIPGKLKAITASMVEKGKERKRLRGPADLYYALADSISMLNETAWQGLADQSGFFMSVAYLKTLERVMPPNISPRYALVYSDDGADKVAVAAVYMQIADISLAQTLPVKSKAKSNARATPLDRIAEVAKQRVLTCGNLLSFGQHGVAFAKDFDSKLAWHGVAEVLYRVRQAEKLAGRTHFVMIKDLHSHFLDQSACLQNLSYRYVETEPNMVLALQEGWKNYDDYLASLAAKYRAGVRKSIFKPVEDAGCTVEQVRDLGTLEKELYALYKAVQINAAFRPFELVPEYFAALEKVAAENFRCSVIKRQGAILGFLMSIADGDTSIAYHIGFDRSAAAELPIYLRLLHAGIADAISMGCKQVSYGRTALEPKAALGARPQAYGILVRHRDPILNKVIKNLLLGIEHDDAPERSPFKKQSSA